VLIGEPISTIKTAYEHLLGISHMIEKARYNDQGILNASVRKSFLKFTFLMAFYTVSL
jgi:hypothetical protein